MSRHRTIVKETVSREIEHAAASPGRKVGEEVHVEITPDRIRVRAYEIYLAHNGAPDDPVADWCQAERELNGHATPQATPDAALNGDPSCEPLVRPDAPEIRVTAGAPTTALRGGV